MYKFNGKELDESTGYYYYGARYYDPAISIFLSVDPLAEKYYPINPYTYVANNPINAIDPDGRKIFPVHGTWSNNNTWKNFDALIGATKNLFGDSNLGASFEWSGGNYSKQRYRAASELVMHIVNERKGADIKEPITIVGHSHGGNVGIIAANILSELEEFNGVEINLLTINTPVRNDYQLSENAKARVNHVNVYDEKDPVQNKGGKGIVVSPIQSTVKGTGEYGPAKRKFDNATNISVDNPQGIGGDFHNSHNRVNDWIKKTE